ncbi:MAG: HNH endonuclease [Bdellovibrionales bacterium]|nr:HNH endonuclease [Bdellovibrionales bacterium]
MDFVYSPQDEKFLKKEKLKARDLRKTRWWQLKLQQGVCAYCEGNFPPEELTMDHRVPLSRGGKSSKNNIVTCCKDCNNKKKNYTSAELLLFDRPL